MNQPSTAPRLGVFHCTVTGATVLGILFLLLWATAAIAGPKNSSGFLVFFTQQALQSPTHAVHNLGWSLLFGGLLGALIAICFNIFRFLSRPGPGERAGDEPVSPRSA